MERPERGAWRVGLAVVAALALFSGARAASDPLPWTYRGALDYRVTATADYGVRGTASCSLRGGSTRVTLNADASVTGELVAPGYYVTFDGKGDGVSSRGHRFAGRYDGDALTASGTAKQSLTLTSGQTATVALTRSISLTRER